MSDAVTSPEALACLGAHLEAENNHDLAAIMETYVASPRVTINGQDFLGTDAVRLFHDRFGFGGDGAFSDVTVKERARHVCGSVEQKRGQVFTLAIDSKFFLGQSKPLV